jgi:insulysin
MFLAQHGGRSNASTSMNVTTFKFDVLAPHAEQALDLFTNFFVAPLFSLSGTSREVHAVDSENSKNLTADVRRRLQILKSLADPDHYYAKFSTGNSNTLATETPEQLAHLREALLAFHSKHYRPEQLTVVVAGPQSLEELEAWVVPRFALMKARSFEGITEAERLVEDGAADAPTFSHDEIIKSEQTEVVFRSPFQPAFQNGVWPVLLTTKPVRSMRRLVLMFPLPPTHLHPDQSPAAVLSHLLGHEGPHSPFAVLQNAGLLSSLSAGPRSTGPDFTLFQVDMGLTQAGEGQWKQVVDVVLQHCKLIAAAAVDGKGTNDLQRIWSESATMRRMFFHQNSPGSVYDLAPNLAASIVKNGTEMGLCAGSMLEETADTFPLEQVADFASRLVLTNCIMERSSQQAWEEMEAMEKSGTVERRTEKWYSVDYFLSNLPDDDIAKWALAGKDAESFLDARNELALPRPNLFIPRSLELCPDLPEEARAGPRIEKEIDPPHLLVDDEKVGRLWHRLDDRYALPKSVVTILIRNAAVNNVKINGVWTPDSEASIHATMLSGIFAEALAQETYDADSAGLHWRLSMTSSGIYISCSGFSDRLPDLALKIVQEFFKGDFMTESFFCSTKDRALRSLRTYFESRRADSHAMYYRDFLLAASDSGVDQSLKDAEAATLESTKRYHRQVLENEESFVECLFSGNVSKEQAQSFFASASDIVTKASSSGKSATTTSMWIPDTLERRLPPKDIELHFASKNTQEENGAVLATYQSQIPGFRGESLSSKESLRSSSTIRLLCHILREPLFDELRTKQTLGYVVSSYYDIGSSSKPDDGLSIRDPATVPIDYIVINILSRKMAPPEVAKRMDEFFVSFRESLLNMPDSQIQHHADALSTKMLKPIQKLSEEASNRFSKIRRYAPEVLQSGKGRQNMMPWDGAPAVARTIQSLTRADLMETWDSMMLPETRSRVLSCVYGTTFPLPGDLKSTTTSLDQVPPGKPTVIVDRLERVVELRQRLSVYDKSVSLRVNTQQRGIPLTRSLKRASDSWLWPDSLPKNRAIMVVAVAAIVGAAGLSLLTRSKKLATSK